MRKRVIFIFLSKTSKNRKWPKIQKNEHTMFRENKKKQRKKKRKKENGAHNHRSHRKFRSAQNIHVMLFYAIINIKTKQIGIKPWSNIYFMKPKLADMFEHSNF